MENTKLRKGDIAVDNAGDVVLVTRVDVQSGEPDPQGRIYIYNVGSYLRSNSKSVGSKWAGQYVRVACHVGDLLKLADQAGYDLLTPSDIPESDLNPMERLERQVKQLQEALKQVAPQSQSEVVARPRTGIASLQKQ